MGEQPIYIDPFSDTGFKAIFGREGMSEEILRKFINEVFRGQPLFEHIREVRFINNERTRETGKDKTIIHDVICTTDNGTRFIVEMQKGDQENFIMRALYYVSRGVTDQAVRLEGDPVWEYNVMPVAGIFVTAFEVEGLPEKLLTHIGLVDLDTKEIVNNHIRFAYIQTPYFNKRQDECNTEFEKIIYTLKNMPTLYAIPFQERENDIYSRMDQLARYANLSPEEKRQYDYELKQKRDRASELSTAIHRAERKGRAEGNAEGREQKAVEIARNLKSLGIDIATIIQSTGLSETEIEKL